MDVAPVATDRRFPGGSDPLGREPVRRSSTQRYSFSGHQTFPFRYAWLPKAVQQVRRDPGLFKAPDALARLGVGQNMVASIRHWGNALDVFSTDVNGTSLRPLGELLFAEPVTPPPNLKKRNTGH